MPHRPSLPGLPNRVTAFLCTFLAALLCATTVGAETVEKGTSEHGTLKTAWSHVFGYIWYHVYPIAPSPAVMDLGFSGANLEVVSGNEEYYAKYNVPGEWYCFDASGSILWTRDTTNDEARTSPTIADVDGDGDYEIGGGTTSGFQFQLMDHTGGFLWRFALESYANNPASPALCDVFAQAEEVTTPQMELIGASLDGSLYCLDTDPSDGVDDGVADYYYNSTRDETDLLWRFQATGKTWQWEYDWITDEWHHVLTDGPSHIFSAPACADINADGTKEIVVGCEAGNVYCVRGSDGSLLWKYTTGAPVFSSAALADVDGDGKREVFIGSQDGTLYCFRPTGEVRWKHTIGDMIDSSPTVADLNGDGACEVVVGSWDSKVYCLDAAGGAVRWSTETGGPVISSPTPANRTGGRLDIYVCSNDGFLYLLHGMSGMVLDRFYAGAMIQSSPTVADIDGDGRLEVLFMDWAAEDNNVTDSYYWSGTGDTLWCLRDMGSQVETHQVEWPMFRGDAAHTGVYTKTFVPVTQALPSLTAHASPTTGVVPMMVNLSMTAWSPGTIVRYEWDLDGDGDYDWSSTESGHTFTSYTEPGTYPATARITDNLGQMATDEVEIVVTNQNLPPVASIHATPTWGYMPLNVLLEGTGEDLDGEIVLYQWDFEGNGSYDWCSTMDGTVSYTYGEEGTFTARLRVTDSDNLSDTAQVTIVVEQADLPPVVLATAAPASGEVPLDVVLTAVGSDDDGYIALWEWDVDGDGHFDWSSDTALTGSTSHTYTEPGTYYPTVRATDDDGMTTTAHTQVDVSETSMFKVWISKPKSGRSISGSAVSIRAQTAQGASATEYVEFQWRVQGDSEWQPLAEVYPPPYSFYDASFDTTGFSSGQVLDLRALGYHVDGVKTAVSPTVTVTVDHTDPDVYEGPDEKGAHHKKEKVSKAYDNEVVVNGGTSVAVKYGILDADTHMKVTLKGENPFPFHGTPGDEVGSFVDIELVDVESFDEPLTITLPYKDADNDGYEDTTGIPEATIAMYVYDEPSGQWEKLFGNAVNVTENTVTAQTPHLSNFGLFSSAPSSVVHDEDYHRNRFSVDGGGGCFLSATRERR